ncbi:hypothetical protein EVAR_102489_1 [Eumeta japonica]|uniref:Uncharacterized protein n=1 Tax=Eumeta variegata TaxID=151549 RepID=A0A4C1T411_EUMVA|nr:hypothetical protein EVAR_102489_1 [Eumeta japonica]
MDSPCARTHGRSVCGCETTGALPGAESARGLGAHMAGWSELVAGTDARGLTAAARLTLRGTPHTCKRAEPDTTERGSKEH